MKQGIGEEREKKSVVNGRIEPFPTTGQLAHECNAVNKIIKLSDCITVMLISASSSSSSCRPISVYVSEFKLHSESTYFVVIVI